jgi:hypothetical protein
VLKHKGTPLFNHFLTNFTSVTFSQYKKGFGPEIILGDDLFNTERE